MERAAFEAWAGIEFLIPVVVVNELNRKGHWGQVAARRKSQRAATIVAVRSLKSKWSTVKAWGRWNVQLTRVGVNEMDKDGNIASLKSIVDALAGELGLPTSRPYLHPKSKRWIAGNPQDRDPRVSWNYAQDFGGGRVPCVRVRISAQLDVPDPTEE